MCCEGCVEFCDSVSKVACCAPAAETPCAEVWWSLAIVGGAAELAPCCATPEETGNVIGDGGANGIALTQLSTDVADPLPGDDLADIVRPPCPALCHGGSI